MKLNRTPNPLDRNARNGENNNWERIEGSIKRIDDTVSDLVLESGGDSNLEVVQARGGKPVLNDRLNDIEEEITDNMSEVSSQLAEVSSQLAETVKLGDSGVLDLNVFDEPTRAAIQGIEPGTINAVLGYKNVKNENLDDKAVAPENTTFIKISTNLFDKNTVKPNTSVNGSGEEYTVNGNNLSEFIKVSPNSQYTLNNPSTDFIVFSYTEDKTYINQVVRAGTFTTLANAGWIRLRVRDADLDQAQLNKGEVLLPYEEYYRTLENVTASVSVGADDFIGKFPLSKLAEPVSSEYRTVMGSRATLSASVPANIQGKKLIFSPPQIRIIWNKNTYAHTITDSLELSLAAQYNYIFYDTKANQFIVLETVYGLPTLPESCVYIGLVAYESGASTAKVMNVDFPCDYMIDGKLVSRVDYSIVNSYIDDVLKTKNLESGVYAEPLSAKWYESGVVEGYDAPSHYEDTISLNDVYDIYDAIVADLPEYGTKVNRGNDSSGTYPVYSYKFSEPEIPAILSTKKKPKITIVTGVHGEEKASVISLRNFMHDVANNWRDNELLEFVRFNVDLVIVPIANPYGFVNHQRKNVNGVDINRNFSRFWNESDSTDPSSQSYKGTSPFSELEAQYVRDVILENKDSIAFFDYHTNGNSGNDYRTMFWHSFSYWNKDLKGYQNLIDISRINIGKMTRESQKRYEIPENSGHIGYISSTGTYMSTIVNYAYGEGLPGITIECTRKLVSEDIVYSSKTMQLCTEFIGNHILNVVRELG